MTYLEKLQKFDKNNLPSLDEVVIGALELFEQNPPKKLDISEFIKPLIAWSGNAIITAKNIFSKTNAIFCDETDIDTCLDKDIDWLIICSASWEKHAIVFAEKAKEKWIKTKLLTCNPNSSTSKIIWEENTIVTSKNREPYTYNVSTYLWWILAVTWEKAGEINKFIENEVEEVLKTIDFSQYNAYLMVTPDRLVGINEMFVRKFFELFWRKIARDVFSYEHIMHALTVVPNEKELAISFWEWDFYFVGDRINFPLPKNTNLATMMAIGYYVIWKIQNSHPQYYKQSINQYISGINNTNFWKWLKVIVE